MIDGTYEAEIDSLPGRNYCSIKLRTEGDEVKGNIVAPILGRQRFVGQLEGEDSFSAQGSVWVFLVGKINYSIRGKLEGDVLHASITSNKGNLEVAADRV